MQVCLGHTKLWQEKNTSVMIAGEQEIKELLSWPSFSLFVSFFFFQKCRHKVSYLDESKNIHSVQQHIIISLNMVHSDSGSP